MDLKLGNFDKREALSHNSAMTSLAAALREQAYQLGFTRLGIIAAQPARRLEAYLEWVAEACYGRMGYMARPDRVVRRQDLQLILPGVQSMVCVALDYYTMQLLPALAADPSRGRISNYAWQVDYHHLFTPRLQQLADWLVVQQGGQARCRVYVDTGAILERDHGETAGLGFTGKNSMLIHPRHGSYFFLGEILTTVDSAAWGEPLAVAEPAAMPSCGRCTRCLTACPTNAFSQPYRLDARRCISYLTIELKEWIPRALRPLLGNWIYGCDVCQEVCPFNRFAQPTAEPAFYAPDHPMLAAAAPALLELLALDEGAFGRQFADSPIRRIGHGRFLRNVCVAVGNWGSDTAVPQLIPLLNHPQPIVRGHAAWALGQIGGWAAQTAVQDAELRETDADVQEELTAAQAP